MSLTDFHAKYFAYELTRRYAIVRGDSRERASTQQTPEAYKACGGQEHFDALDVPFYVVVTADEVSGCCSVRSTSEGALAPSRATA